MLGLTLVGLVFALGIGAIFDVFDSGNDTDVVEEQDTPLDGQDEMGSGEDTIASGSGDDTIAGDDTVGGEDTVGGSADDDIDTDTIAPSPDEQGVTLNGTDDSDNLIGGSAEDSLFGFLGDDSLEGGAGADLLNGGEGIDTLRGGAGSDSLLGEAGNDRLDGESGDDIMRGGDDDDNLFGSLGQDILYGEEGSDTLHGSFGDDTLFGGNGDDAVSGWDGNDQLFGGLGDDNLFMRESGEMTGGDGADVFAIDVRTAIISPIVITDFTAGEDSLEVAYIATTDADGNPVVPELTFTDFDDGTGTTVFMDGVEIAQITGGQALTASDVTLRGLSS